MYALREGLRTSLLAHPVASRLLAFFGAAIVGLSAPTGCVVAPNGLEPTSESIRGILWGPCHGGEHGHCKAPCGAAGGESTACDECDCPPGESSPCDGGSECEPACERRPKCHLPHCHLYDPEAGIFNFCIPPQCINEPPPLPPGRFFPVPVRPAFAAATSCRRYAATPYAN